MFLRRDVSEFCPICLRKEKKNANLKNTINWNMSSRMPKKMHKLNPIINFIQVYFSNDVIHLLFNSLFYTTFSFCFPTVMLVLKHNQSRSFILYFPHSYAGVGIPMGHKCSDLVSIVGRYGLRCIYETATLTTPRDTHPRTACNTISGKTHFFGKHKVGNTMCKLN